MVIGSGNITPGGHGKNHEIFTCFYAENSDSPHLPVLLETWDYLRHLINTIPGFQAERIEKTAQANNMLRSYQRPDKHCFYQIDTGYEVALLYNEQTSIFSQLTTLVPKAEISEISVISPYFDENGEALISIKEQYTNAALDVFLPQESGLPPVNISDINNISFYKWDDTDRAQAIISGDNSYKRKLHGKIYHFKSPGFEYLLIGSANATRNGIGGPVKGVVNEEFCLLYKSTEFDILNRLGITGKKTPVNPNSLSRENSQVGKEDQKHVRNLFFILSADLKGKELRVYTGKSRVSGKINLAIFDDYGQEIFFKEVDNSEQQHIISLSEDIKKQKLTYVAFINSQHQLISNKQLINDILRLSNTDPSRSDRTLRQYIYDLEAGSINEFEIIDYCNEINKGRGVSNKNITAAHGSASSQKLENSQESQHTYQEALEALKNKADPEKIINSHHTVRFWDTWQKAFTKIKEVNEDELMGEEDQSGDSSKGNDRKTIRTGPTFRKNDEILDRMSALKKNIDYYEAQINRISADKSHKIGIIDLSEFLLLSHIMTAICMFSTFENLSEKEMIEGNKKLRNFYKVHMNKILKNFIKLFINHTLESYQSEEVLKDKFNIYLERAINNCMLYFYLLDHMLHEKEEFLREEIRIMALNLFHYNTPPMIGFEQHFNHFNTLDGSRSINFLALLKFNDQLIDLYTSANEKPNYIKLPNSGYCQILEKTSNKIRYRSIHGINSISKSELKKNHIKLN